MAECIAILGGAGFVGANLAIGFKRDHPRSRVVAADSLRRRGSELNLSRLRSSGVEFLHADTRSSADLERLGAVDVLIDCAADPAVASGFGTVPADSLGTNLGGTVNALEVARRRRSVFVFLSTSRVYPLGALRGIDLVETDSRFELPERVAISGLSPRGVGEAFPLNGPRTLYGAAKLASELLVVEYLDQFNLHGVIDRCSVIAGPWQFGKIDQGIVALWVMHHVFQRPLDYIGYGGTGKQVRDILHVGDLYALVSRQLDSCARHAGEVYNVGGGMSNRVSLQELSALCSEVSGNTLAIGARPDNRAGDIPWFVTDNSKVAADTSWSPRRSPRDIVVEVSEWAFAHRASLEPMLAYPGRSVRDSLP